MENVPNRVNENMVVSHSQQLNRLGSNLPDLVHNNETIKKAEDKIFSICIKESLNFERAVQKYTIQHPSARH